MVRDELATTDQRESRLHQLREGNRGIGIPSTDEGRILGAPLVLTDPLNDASVYSDDPVAGRAKLTLVVQETAQEGAFRTASLRGVGQRTFFGHASHEETRSGFILDIYRGGGGGQGRGNNATVGTRDPLLDGVNVDNHDVDDLIAFLHTLDCPTTPRVRFHGIRPSDVGLHDPGITRATG